MCRGAVLAALRLDMIAGAGPALPLGLRAPGPRVAGVPALPLGLRAPGPRVSGVPALPLGLRAPGPRQGASPSKAFT
jgi:hypothetical protein